MNTKNLIYCLLGAATMMLYSQCVTPTFDEIEHPFEVKTNDTTKIPITVIHGEFPQLADSLLTPEMSKAINLCKQDILPMLQSRDMGYHLWLGMQVPENWTVIDSFDYVAYDALPATIIDSGLFVYSQTHADLLNNPKTGYKWLAWVSNDTLATNTGKLWTFPKLITDNTSGIFYLDYVLGYDSAQPCDERQHILTIASPMLDEAWVTNTNDEGDGSLRKATMDVRSGGTVQFNIDLNDTIFLSDEIEIYKPFSIDNQQSDSLVNITVNEQNTNNIFSFNHEFFHQSNPDNYYDARLNGLNLFGSANHAIHAIETKYLQISGCKLHDNNGTAIQLEHNNSGLYLEATVTGTEIYNNSGEYGGGIFSNIDNIHIQFNTRIHHNSATSGGGIYMAENSQLSLIQLTIDHNSVSEYGGGIFMGDYATIWLDRVTISQNHALLKGGGCYFGNNTEVEFDDYLYRLSNVYLNQSLQGNDLFTEFRQNPIAVVVDTFTVLNPTPFHTEPFDNYTFDIEHGYLEQVTDDLYLSPDGDNQNSGTSEDEPIKNFYYAFAKTLADTSNQQTLHLLEGTYSPSTTDELFPVILPDYIDLVGTSDSLVTMDAEKTGRVFHLQDLSSNTIQGMTITGGETEQSGGAIYCMNSNPLIQNVTIYNNVTGGDGGGIYCSGSNPTIENVTISNNEASQDGGGLYCLSSDPILQNVDFLYNAANNGGGLCIDHSYPDIENMVVAENSALNCGGGMWFNYTKNLGIKNSTINNNTAKFGGGCYFGISTSGHLFNDTNRCNIYFNQAIHGNDLYSNKSSNVYVRVDTLTVMHPGDWYAEPFHYFNFDIWNAKIEQVDADLYVSPEGDNNNSGLTPDEPLKNINEACKRIIADFDHLHIIYLMDGIYSPTTSGDEFPISLPSCLSLIGTSQENTILDAEGQSGVLHLNYDINNTISNLTITGGYAEEGAGIYMYKSYPVIENVLLGNNIASENGGGICIDFSTPKVSNLSVFDNSADHGGGIYIKSSNPKICNTKVQENYAKTGGGLYVDHASPSFINCLLANNNSSGSGGAFFFNEFGSPDLINVTIANNTAGIRGGGFYSYYSIKTLLYNSILWNNSPHEVHQGAGLYNEVSVFYSTIEGGYAGMYGTVYWMEGATDVDPEFQPFGTGDDKYTLTPISPCIDAGRPDTTGLYLPEYDLMGNYRLWDGDDDGEARIDMGVFEYASIPVDVVTPTTEPEFAFQCYPNPTYISSEIKFELKKSENVQIEIYNLLGNKVDEIIDRELPKGNHQLNWNTKHLANGCYFLHFQAGTTTATQKILKH